MTVSSDPRKPVKTAPTVTRLRFDLAERRIILYAVIGVLFWLLFLVQGELEHRRKLEFHEATRGVPLIPQKQELLENQ